jgi:hypothetical protein
MEAFLSDTLSLFRDKGGSKHAALLRFCEAHRFNELMDTVARIGATGPSRAKGDTTRQVIHDLKGGAFASLCLWLQAIEPGGEGKVDERKIFFLARDHLKMLRNAVCGLSPEGEGRVREHLRHGVALLVEKWGDTVHRFANKEINVVLQTSFSGSISESCLEFAALDRIFYNLVNNAARHGGRGGLSIFIFDPSGGRKNLRFVFKNPIGEEQKHALRNKFGERVSDVFLGGFTTGGSGIGTRVCAEFVRRAYGLPGVEEAVEGGYIGGAVRGSEFWSWFHWPIAAGDVSGETSL